MADYYAKRYHIVVPSGTHKYWVGYKSDSAEKLWLVIFKSDYSVFLDQSETPRPVPWANEACTDYDTANTGEVYVQVDLVGPETYTFELTTQNSEIALDYDIWFSPMDTTGSPMDVVRYDGTDAGSGPAIAGQAVVDGLVMFMAADDSTWNAEMHGAKSGTAGYICRIIEWTPTVDTSALVTAICCGAWVPAAPTPTDGYLYCYNGTTLVLNDDDDGPGLYGKLDPYLYLQGVTYHFEVTTFGAGQPDSWWYLKVVTL